MIVDLFLFVSSHGLFECHSINQSLRLHLVTDCPWNPLPHPLTMDVVAAVSGYISRMVTAGDSASASSSLSSSSAKMKILLLDSETVGTTAFPFPPLWSWHGSLTDGNWMIL